MEADSPGPPLRRGPLPALLIGIVLLANLTTAVGYAARERGHQTQIPTSQATTVPDFAAARDLLARRSRAVLARDRSAFLATVDPAAPAFRAGQQRLFDNLVKLPLGTWRHELAGTGASRRGSWTARLELRYRLADFDTAEVTRTQYLTFTRRSGLGWTVSGDGFAYGLRDDPEIWDTGRLHVVRGRHSLVIGADGSSGSSGRLAQIADRLDAAVPAVTGVVGDDWDRRVVALVPATQRLAASMVGEERNLSQIAALATTMSGPSGEDRIIIAPATFAKLNALGRRVVLTHELTHVATGGAVDTRTPMWLIEGLADYVGYRGTGVSVRSAARELAGEVRSGQVSQRLPGREDFSDSSRRLSQAYQEAWLACRMIVDRYGQDSLVRLYRTAGRADADPTGTGIGPARAESAALRRVLGVGAREFTAMWRDYLREELA